MPQINNWIHVVVLPLGLAAFALYLLFEYLKSKGRKPKWLMHVACVLVATALIGGLLLHYFGAQEAANSPNQAVQPTSVKQETKGDQSPAISSQGDVSITYGEQRTKDNRKGRSR